MPFDEDLAQRIRMLLADEAAVTEQPMFGGLAFLVAGKMAVAASGRGGLMVRVDPSETARLLGTTSAEPMEMRGRAVRGWLRVGAESVRTTRQLTRWVTLGTEYARSLPPTRPGRTRRPRRARDAQ